MSEKKEERIIQMVKEVLVTCPNCGKILHFPFVYDINMSYITKVINDHLFNDCGIMSERKNMPKPFKRVMLEWRGKIPKELLLQVIEEYYGKNLISLSVIADSLRIEIIE